MACRGFPEFSNGNVEIHFGNNEKWILLGDTLDMHSGWFKASLNPRWNNGATRTNYRYELRFEKNKPLGWLEAQTPGTATEMIGAEGETEDLHDERLECIIAHQDVIGAMFIVKPAFKEENFEVAKKSILLATEVAKYYNCEHVIQIPVDNHLHNFATDIQDLCASEPLDMLEFSITVKSGRIFMEAATNLLGRCRQDFDSAKPRLAELNIANLFKKKREEFTRRLQDCEYRLLRLPAPANQQGFADKYSSQAISSFSLWLKARLAQGQGSGLARGYAQVYWILSAGNTLDLTQWSNRLFLTHNPADLEMLNRNVEPYVTNVLQMAQTTIQPILRDVTKRKDRTPDPFKSLKFMGVSDSELPWVKK